VWAAVEPAERIRGGCLVHDGVAGAVQVGSQQREMYGLCDVQPEALVTLAQVHPVGHTEPVPPVGHRAGPSCPRGAVVGEVGSGQAPAGRREHDAAVPQPRQER
jgi:hypothetical protein